MCFVFADDPARSCNWGDFRGDDEKNVVFTF